MKKLTHNSNYKIFHDLQSDLKVSEMGWEVKKIIRGQSKQYLRVFNLHIVKFLPQDCQDQICHTIFRTMPSLWPPSGAFEHFYRHSNISYGDLMGWG